MVGVDCAMKADCICSIAQSTPILLAAKKDFATVLATMVIFVVFVSKNLYNNVQVILYSGGGDQAICSMLIFFLLLIISKTTIYLSPYNQ
jgi:hypothetical protein